MNISRPPPREKKKRHTNIDTINTYYPFQSGIPRLLIHRTSTQPRSHQIVAPSVPFISRLAPNRPTYSLPSRTTKNPAESALGDPIPELARGCGGGGGTIGFGVSLPEAIIESTTRYNLPAISHSHTFPTVVVYRAPRKEHQHQPLLRDH